MISIKSWALAARTYIQAENDDGLEIVLVVVESSENLLEVQLALFFVAPGCKGTQADNLILSLREEAAFTWAFGKK